MAIFLWNVLEAMIQGFANIEIGQFRAPRWLATLLGLAVVILGFCLISSVLLGEWFGRRTNGYRAVKLPFE
jgi:hypothetical protein